MLLHSSGPRSHAVWCSLVALLLTAPAVALDLEQPPLNYSKTTPDDCIRRLQSRINQGSARLRFEDEHGYLKDVLRALDVPLSSQVLVFSKTSLQRQRIGPKTPRALYFNDDVYIGFCWCGDVLEVAAVDPQLGTVFYTLDQQPQAKPTFVRQGDNCLICHASSLTKGYPGHVLRSVFTDHDGQPILSLGTARVDQQTRFAERWGGWYVTGTSGQQQHRGNTLLPSRLQEPPTANPEGLNVTDLRARFTVANYLTPHSDLVALMVLEHQTEMHNRITRAGYETRLALHQQAEFDRILGRTTEGLSDSTTRRMKGACEDLLRYMLFSGEAQLAGKLRGTSTFTADFAVRGPRDGQGRSLRQFDLQTRLFAYPCSYLIYAHAFQELPREAKSYLYARLHAILVEGDSAADYAHLSASDRQALRGILNATLPDLAAAWRK